MSKPIEVVVVTGLTAAAFPNTVNAADIDVSTLVGLRDIESGDILIAGLIPEGEGDADIRAHFTEEKLDDVPPAPLWFMLGSPVVTADALGDAQVRVL